MFETHEDAVFLVDSIAYTMHGNKNAYDYIFCWIGAGGNGKSVCLDLIEVAFGSYWEVLPCSNLTERFSSSTSAKPDFANKKGKRIVTSTEPQIEDGEFKVRVDVLKSLSDPISARLLHKNPVTFRPQFTLIIQSQNEPKFSNTVADGGILRRFRGQRFPYQFRAEPNPNDKFEKKMNPELKELVRRDEYRDAFMRILIRTYFGRIKGMKQLEIPPNVLSFMAEVEDDNNKVATFLQNYCEITGDENDKVNTITLYREYARYAGENPDRDNGQFGKALKKHHGITRNKRNYKGVKLLPDEATKQPQPDLVSFYGESPSG